MQLFKNTFFDSPNRFTYLCFFIVTFFASTLCFSQVGINTLTPNALLDIQSSSQATPTNTDGVLIPKVDAFPLINPTASQDGMMVFVTGNGTPTKGFYYWNNPTSAWIAFTAIGAEKIDDLLDGKSDNDGTQNGSSVFLGINSGLNDDSSDNWNVGIGFEALQANTSGTGNIANGYQSLYNNTGGNWNVANGRLSLYSNTNGNNNTANGNQSLYSNTDGSNNTVNGYESGYSNTTGTDNTASGMQSFYTNTIGDNNTAYGVTALYLNTEGNDNTANGYRSLYTNTTGSLNTANGNQALFSNTIGNRNTANGYQTLFSNTEGNNNAANGSRSLFSNTTGNENTANGYQALYTNTDGDYNSAIGSFSLFFNTTGNNNVGVGYQSLLSNTIGSFNVGIGRDSGASNISGSNNVFLGYQAGFTETGSNKLYIESSNANADNALIYGEFDTNILRTNSQFQIGNPTGTGFAFPTTDGTANQVLQTNGNGAISWIDGSTLGTNDADWFEEGTTTSPNDINDDMFTMGNVAIGKNTADYALDITEDSEITVINASLTSSDDLVTSVLRIENANSGNLGKRGITTEFNGSANGDKTSIYNTINNTGTGVQTGIRNILSSTSVDSQVGVSNRLENSGDGSQTAVSNFIDGSGVGQKYGCKTHISSTAGGTHYGVYSKVLKPQNYAGFFLGLVTFGTSVTDRYIFPISPGTNGQIMQTNGIGQLSWVTPNYGDITGVTAGTGLIGGGTTGTVTLNVIAYNGLTTNANDVVLGGSLTQATTITQGTNNMVFNLNSTGDFIVQDSSVDHFEVRSTGLTYFGDDTYWKEGSTTGTTIASLINDGNDGRFRIYENGSTSVDLDANSQFIFNQQGLDRDFRIEGDSETNLFRIDAGNDRIGIMEGAPDTDIHLKQSGVSEGGSGGMTFEDSGDSDQWKIYHSGTHFSFAENGTRRAYVEGGTGNYVQPSDERLKRDFILQKNYLSKLKDIKIYSYLYKSQSNHKRNIGVKAQELQQLFPELISEGEDGYLGMNYAGLGVIAIQAIKEQQKVIDSLESENQQLNTLLSQLLKRVENLENKN